MKGTAIALLVLLLLVVLVTAFAFACGSAAPGTTASTGTATSSDPPSTGSASTTGSAATSEPVSTSEPAATTGSSAPVDIAQGKNIFGDNCARCHGADGKGIIGPNLQNQTDLAKVEGQVRSGGRTMPAFGGQLSAAQISAVAQFVLSLAGN